MVLSVLLKHKGTSLYERFRDLFPRFREDPLDRASGYPHLVSRLFLRKVLEVAESECFELVAGKDDLPDVAHRNTRGLEGLAPEGTSAGTRFLISRHAPPRSLCAYAHNIPKPSPLVKLYLSGAHGIHRDSAFLIIARPTAPRTFPIPRKQKNGAAMSAAPCSLLANALLAPPSWA